MFWFIFIFWALPSAGLSAVRGTLLQSLTQTPIKVRALARIEAEILFIAFRESSLDCARDDKSNKKIAADSQKQLLKSHHKITFKTRLIKIKFFNWRVQILILHLRKRKTKTDVYISTIFRLSYVPYDFYDGILAFDFPD